MSKHKCVDSLGSCYDHPRWSVSSVPLDQREDDEPWGAYAPATSYTSRWFPTQAEAFAYATSRARAERLAAVQSAEGVTVR